MHSENNSAYLSRTVSQAVSAGERDVLFMIFDAHCDTLSKIHDLQCGLRKNELCVDLERLAEYDGYTQFFAVWLSGTEGAKEKFNALVDIFEKEIEKNADIAKKCLSFKDMKSAQKSKKTAAFLSLEGAYFVNNERDIDFLYQRGVRCMSLTWNYTNKLAGGALSEDGMTRLGLRLAAYAEEKGILTDVSHLNEKSFWELTDILKKPFIASHSCSKTLCRHCRNLTDEQLLRICRAGGCVGINFFGDFLSETKNSSIADIICHMAHLKKIGSVDCIGFGSDFDGTDLLPDGITGAESMNVIEDMLKKKGFSFSETEKITYKNFARVINGVL